MNVFIDKVLDDDLLAELREMMDNLGPQPLPEGEDPESQLGQMATSDYWSPVVSADDAIARKKNYECMIQSGSQHVQKVLPILANKLMENKAFASVGLVDCLFPPKFNKYDAGCFYGSHCDEPLARDGNGRRLRADMAYTLWLSDQQDYVGGELVIDDGMSEPQMHKPKAGSLLLYSATDVHRVDEVISGTRYAMVGWAQSLIADESLRQEVYRVNKLLDELGNAGERGLFLKLEAHRNTLLRLWSN